MTLTEAGARAFRELLAAQDRLGSNCQGRWEEFSGPEPVSKERAVELCRGCPLSGLGNVCQQYAAVAHQIYGVYDGVWLDEHGDAEVGWEEEQAMVAALGIEELEPTEEGDENA